MRNGEIVDLANERRLSAVLDFARGTADLLVLNGGSKAEEFTVYTSVRGWSSAKSERSVYCIDSGTSMHLRLPLPAGRTPSDLTVRIIGEHGSMLLRDMAAATPHPLMRRRTFVAAACALMLSLFSGGSFQAPTPIASADPEPPPADAPLVSAKVSLNVPARLPRVVVQPAHDVRSATELGTTHLPKLGDRRVVAMAALPDRPTLSHRRDVLPATAAQAVPLPTTPTQTAPPRMTDLHVPTTAKSGEFVAVRYGAVGHQVKIVASIGPEVVAKTVVTAQRGTVNIKSPKSDRLSRVMTVRAYAQDGNRSSSLQAIVVLVHP
jgi:hypothetical protein